MTQSDPMVRYEFFVPGLPAPGGSKRYIGKGRIIEDCKRTTGWRASVAGAAIQAGCTPISGPLGFTVLFYLPRPKGHFHKNGLLKTSAPAYPTVRPDTTKLLRSTEDALKGIAWHDDAQIVWQVASKRYTLSTEVGAEIKVEIMPC